jgi:hypothetical protein
MARTALSKQQSLNNGLTPAFSAGDSANGHSFVNDGHQMLYVKNGGGSSINVTISTTGKLAGLSLAALVIAVPNGQERMIGPFDPTVFNQADGNVYADLSGATSVTVGVFQVG